MENRIRNLWPEDISVDVLSPVAALRSQAGLLREKTKGLVDAEVVDETIKVNQSEQVQLRLNLIAPMLKNARFGILTATHDSEQVYPVEVQADIFRPTDESDVGYWSPPLAVDESEFFQLLRKVLNSPHTKSLINSIIARSNDLKSASKQ